MHRKMAKNKIILLISLKLSNKKIFKFSNFLLAYGFIISKDADGDGVHDAVDSDDDNDGLLDTGKYSKFQIL